MPRSSLTLNPMVTWQSCLMHLTLLLGLFFNSALEISGSKSRIFSRKLTLTERCYSTFDLSHGGRPRFQCLYRPQATDMSSFISGYAPLPSKDRPLGLHLPIYFRHSTCQGE